jgi:uncharacterized membrane protein
VHAAAEDDPDSLAAFVPHLAVNGAVIMAAVSVFVLIYFIHHVPQSINVTNVTTRVGDELVRGIRLLYPEQIGHGRRGDADRPSLPDGFADSAKVIRIRDHCGYLRLVDHETLLTSAREEDLVIQILKHPGEYLLRGEQLLRVWPADKIDDALQGSLLQCFSWGSERTPNQDVLLPLHQLLEIIGRALSPGVNNQYTAVLSLNQIGRGLQELLSRQVPDARRLDEQGVVRIVAEPVSHADFLNALSGPLKQYLTGDWIASTHMLDLFRRLAALPELSASRPLLERVAAGFSVTEPSAE